MRGSSQALSLRFEGSERVEGRKDWEVGAGDLEMERSCGEVKFSRVLSMDMVFFLVGGEAVGETPVFLFPISVEDLFKEDGVSLSAGHGFLG